MSDALWSYSVGVLEHLPRSTRRVAGDARFPILLASADRNQEPGVTVITWLQCSAAHATLASISDPRDSLTCPWLRTFWAHSWYYVWHWQSSPVADSCILASEVPTGRSSPVTASFTAGPPKLEG